jgi:hypothetical protein
MFILRVFLSVVDSFIILYTYPFLDIYKKEKKEKKENMKKRDEKER